MIEITSGTTVDGVAYTQIKRGTNYTRYNRLYVRYDSDSGYFSLAGADSAAYLTFKRGEVSIPSSINDLDLLNKLTDLALLPLFTTGGGGGGGAITAADGAIVSLGATTDAPAVFDNSNVSLIALFKRLLQRISTLISWATRNVSQIETPYTVDTISITTICPANTNRKSLKIYNRPGQPAVRFGLDSTLTIFHILPAGGTNGYLYEYPEPVPTNAIYARSNTGVANIIVTEG